MRAHPQARRSLGRVWQPRTLAFLTVGLAHAGLEIRDTLVWLFAEGQPKSVNVGFQIDRRVCERPGRHFKDVLPSSAEGLQIAGRQLRRAAADAQAIARTR